MRIRTVGDLMLGDSAICVGFGFRSRYPDADRLEQAAASAESLLQGADLVLGNLETPLADASDQEGRWRRLQMRGRPEYAAVLRKLGFTHLNVANNHAIQHGRGAFAESLAVLANEGIVPIGLRGDGPWQCRPVLWEHGGEVVGLLGYCLRPRQYSRRAPPFAEGSHAEILADVARLGTGGRPVVVSLHWGEEFVSHPSVQETRRARELHEAGAVLIWGHHPHVARPVTWSRNGVSAYSLGNFIADMVWHEPLRHGTVLTVELTRDGISTVSVVAVRLNNAFLPVAGTVREITDPEDNACPALSDDGYSREVARTIRAQQLSAYRYAATHLHRYVPGVLPELLAATIRNKFTALIRRSHDSLRGANGTR